MKKGFRTIFFGLVSVILFTVLRSGSATFDKSAVLNGERPTQLVQSARNRGASRPETKPANEVLPSKGRRLSFERNEGQFEPRASFVARGPGYGIKLLSEGAGFEFSANTGDKRSPKLARQKQAHSSLKSRMLLAKASKPSSIEALEELPGKVNYFIGNKESQWRTNVPTFGKVRMNSIYPGIDVTYYGDSSDLEFDFEIAPGAKAQEIRLSFPGADRIRIDKHGDLILFSAGTEITQKKPVGYQIDASGKHLVSVEYDLSESGVVKLIPGSYDQGLPLIIDPVILYSTFFGGGWEEGATVATTDSDGNLYVSGQTISYDFPTVNPVQPQKGEYAEPPCTRPGCGDAFISKLDPTGTQLLYSTFLGGSYIDGGLGIAVDSQGDIYVTGTTNSDDFPTTLGAYQRYRNGLAYDGIDGFIAKLTNNGSVLFYSTYLGGSATDVPYNIAIDKAGSAYVTGITESKDYPIIHPLRTTQVEMGKYDGFISKINYWGTELEYSTYIGGSDDDECLDIEVDGDGYIYVTGNTYSTDFPTTLNAYQSVIAGLDDIFVCKITPDGSDFVFSTLVGGQGSDEAASLTLDAAKNVYVSGHSVSKGSIYSFPLVNPLQRETNFDTVYDALSEYVTDVVVFKISNDGASLLYSTFLGGENEDNTLAKLAVDTKGRIYVTGYTSSFKFPVTPDAFQPVYGGGFYDAFISVLDPSRKGWDSLVYSSYLGGDGIDLGQSCTLDSNGNIYVVGLSRSSYYGHFPSVGGIQPHRSGLSDAFITKISLNVKDPSDTISPTVAITSPAGAEPIVVSGGRITLSGVASDDKGVTQVSWHVALDNQDSTTGITYGVAEGTSSWVIKDIPVQIGNSRIIVSASDAAGNVGESSIHVTYRSEYLIDTFAGRGKLTPADGLFARDVKTGFLRALAVSPNGEIAFSDIDSQIVWKITKTHQLVKVAGSDRGPDAGDGGLAVNATLGFPWALFYDPQGNLFITERGPGGTVRKVDTNGIITTVAGMDGNSCSPLVYGIDAKKMRMCWTSSSAMNSKGELFISQQSGNVIIKVGLDGIGRRFAGTGESLNTGDGGPAIIADVSAPENMSIDKDDNLYFSAGDRVRKITPDGIITTVLGGGSLRPANGIPATSMKLVLGGKVAFDKSGNLLIALLEDALVVRVNKSGIADIIAGEGANGYSGDGGSPTVARVVPWDIAVDDLGRIFVLEAYDIRVLYPTQEPTTTKPSVTITSPTSVGSLSTVTSSVFLGGNVASPFPIVSLKWVNSRGGQGQVFGDPAWRSPAIRLKPGINQISITALDSSGASNTASIAVSYDQDPIPPTIRITSPSANRTYSTSEISLNISGTATDNLGVARVSWHDDAGNYGIAQGLENWSIQGYAVRSASTTLYVTAEDVSGNKTTDTLSITFNPEYMIYSVVGPATSSLYTPYSGESDSASRSLQNPPFSMYLDESGEIYVGQEWGNRVLKIRPDLSVTRFAGTGINGYSGDGGPAVLATLYGPEAIIRDKKGNILIGDAYNHVIRAVSPDGTITRYAGTGKVGSDGDGGQAINARMAEPHMFLYDKEGNLIFSDASYCTIRKISPAGIIATIAGVGSCGFTEDGRQAKDTVFGNLFGIALDKDNNLYVAERSNNRIRKISSQGVVTTIAGSGSDYGFSGDGGLATSAQLSFPEAVAIDADGSIFIADTGNNRVRKVDKQGVIRTVAGWGPASRFYSGYNGDGIPANLAMLGGPRNIYFDSKGTLYIVDTQNLRIRKLVKPASNAKVTTTVPATSYVGNAVAPESLAAAFGQNLATQAQGIAALPLPLTLAGTSVTIIDSKGVERPAPLLYVSPSQVNYQVPKEISSGTARVVITNGQGEVSTGSIYILPVSPGVFTASSDGSGPAASTFLRITPDNTEHRTLSYRFDQTMSKFVTVPYDLGSERDLLFLELYCSGVRNRAAIQEMTATIGGIPAEIVYGGPQGFFVGVDQINLRIPRELKGRGEVEVVITVAGQTANRTKINIQ